MSITLPLSNQTWPLLRVLTRKAFGSSPKTPQTSGSGGWKTWPVNQATGMKNGMYVIDWDRACLPMIGRARFGIRFGLIDGNLFTAPDLNGNEVRIQAADPDAPTEWRTVWWGQVDTTQDVGWPGAAVTSGDRIYNCVDALYRVHKWRLDRHGYAAVSPTATEIKLGQLRGHPGYNMRRTHDSRLAGNRWVEDGDQWVPDASAAGASVGLCNYHTQPGSAHTGTTLAGVWTDQDAIEHALASVRRPGEPLFQLNFLPTTANALLVGTSAWPVREGDTVWDLLTRILRRERGRGVAYLDWTDGSSNIVNPAGTLTAKLTIMPQMYGDISYQDPTPGGTLVTISGAQADSRSVVSVDLINDQRNVAEAFKLGDKDQFRLDGLESVGECIQVVITTSFADGASGSTPNVEGHSVKRAWSAAEQSTFRGLAAVKRQEERWRPIYNRFRLPINWDFQVGNGNGGTLSRCDYRCAGGYSEKDAAAANIETGTILAFPYLDEADNGLDFTSPLGVEILSDLPLYESWKYTSSPVRWDAEIERSDETRRPILALLKVADNKFIKVEELLPQMTMKVDGDLIWFYDSQGLGDGTRPISDPTESTLGAAGANAKYENLSFTIAIQLPHRVRFYSGLRLTDPNCRRRAQIYHPEHHLWLAHPDAIWDLDATSGTPSTGHSPRRNAAAGTATAPGLLRDDRQALALMHFLTWAWYGTDRRTAAWSLRCCGFLPTFAATPGTGQPTDGTGSSAIVYATMGQTVHSLKANGQEYTIDTPITRISYDNQSGITTWETDWSVLDLQQ